MVITYIENIMKRTLLAATLLVSLTAHASTNSFINDPRVYSTPTDTSLIQLDLKKHADAIDTFSQKYFQITSLNEIATCTQHSIFTLQVPENDLKQTFVKLTIANNPAGVVTSYADTSKIRSEWNCSYDDRSINRIVTDSFNERRAVFIRIAERQQFIADESKRVEKSLTEMNERVEKLNARRSVAEIVLKDAAKTLALRDQCVKNELLEPADVMASSNALIDNLVEQLGPDYNAEFLDVTHAKFSADYKEVFENGDHLRRNYYCHPEVKKMKVFMEKQLSEK